MTRKYSGQEHHRKCLEMDEGQAERKSSTDDQQAMSQDQPNIGLYNH